MNKKEFYKRADFLHKLFDAIPVPVLIADSDVKIQMMNKAAAAAFDITLEAAYDQRAGESLDCIHAAEEGGCGLSDACRDCVIRNSVRSAVQGKTTYRRRTMLTLMKEGAVTEVNLLVTAAPFEYERRTFVLLTFENINELLQLRSLLPICANCKKIRDEGNYWESLEGYFKTCLDMDFTHSICPECMKKLYPEVYKEMYPQG